MKIDIEIISFKSFLKEGLKSENDKINNKMPKTIKATDSRSNNVLYEFTLNGDKYTAKSSVQNIDNDEVKQLEDITGKTYSLGSLKLFLEKIKSQFAFINISMNLD